MCSDTAVGAVAPVLLITEGSSVLAVTLTNPLLEAAEDTLGKSGVGEWAGALRKPNGSASKGPVEELGCLLMRRRSRLERFRFLLLDLLRRLRPRTGVTAGGAWTGGGRGVVCTGGVHDAVL